VRKALLSKEVGLPSLTRGREFRSLRESVQHRDCKTVEVSLRGQCVCQTLTSDQTDKRFSGGCGKA